MGSIPLRRTIKHLKSANWKCICSTYSARFHSSGIIYFNSPHWTDVRLDKGSGAEFRDGELVCTRHGATFLPDSGECTYGPCEGATLEEVDVAVDDDGVYLAEEDYEFDHLGPKSDRDLSSGRIGFSGN